MSNNKNSYRSIMKATSIFGGVQVFNIITSIVRSKFIAVFIGPAGMGVVGLYKSTLDIIGQVTNLGLNISAVKNVSEANAHDNEIRVAKTIKILRRLVLITGAIGSFLVFILSKWLSKLTFGSYDYSLGFKVLSITILLAQIASGQRIVLQGLRKLQHLASASVLSNILGLIIIIPIYYFYRIDGVVSVMLLTSIISLFIYSLFSKRVQLPKVKVETKEIITEGKAMISMGVIISISGILTLVEAYIIRIYISNTGNIDDVGFYNAGLSIISTYVGMIFTAMGTDYYPRLSGVANDNSKLRETVNHQSEIATLIITPILCVFFIFINYVVILLYSNKFLPVVDMINWAAIGVFFKVPSWSVGYLFLAKGDSKSFFLNDLLVISYVLLFNLLGYNFFGLQGLGVSFFIAFLFSFIQNSLVTYKLYSFKFSKVFFRIFVVELFFVIATFIVSQKLDGVQLYVVGSFLIVCALFYSYKELDKRLDIHEAIEKIKQRILKKK